MKLGVAFLAALAVLAATPASAAAQDPLPTAAVRLPELANGLCVDVVSGRVALPADVSGDDGFNAGYGLTTGVSKPVMDAFGPDIGLLAQARLASGETAEGPVVVAMGGRAGETCRLIVMSGSQDPALGSAVHMALQADAYGWRDMPTAQQSPLAIKRSALKRDPKGNPFLINILTPAEPGPVAMVVIVAAIPPYVTLPEGY